jgi:chromosome segregation ATPase
MIRLAISVLLLTVAALPCAAQQHHRDPLTDLEIDQLRDAAQEPEARLKLYIAFARARLEKLQQIRSDPKITDKDQQIRAALQDFTEIYDELDENVDTFADRGDDLRKAIKPVIEADTEFGSKLRAFKLSLESSRDEAEKYDFLLGTAMEAVDSAAKDHRDLLAEQDEKFKNKKNKAHKESARGE